MRTEHMSAARRRKPFAPFQVRASSGETYTVTHPELCYITPAGLVVIIETKPQGEQMVIIESDHISEIRIVVIVLRECEALGFIVRPLRGQERGHRTPAQQKQQE